MSVRDSRVFLDKVLLKGAVRTHGGKNRETIAALVPGRRKVQCRKRSYNALVSNIDPVTARKGRWTTDENMMLKYAISMYGGKKWGAIARLVPGRTIKQCRDRWRDVLDPSIGRATARVGKWTADEATMLEYAVSMYGGKHWEAIAALVPGRTKVQCRKRWHNTLISNVVTVGQEDSRFRYLPTHSNLMRGEPSVNRRGSQPIEVL
jgi:myb proto-oncogene protein